MPGKKPLLSFYTNMPTPYQIDFFNSLKLHFDLNVIYFTDRESDRQWNLTGKGSGYITKTLKSGWFTKRIQKRIVSYHFSWKIIPLLFNDRSEYILVNGTYWSPNVVLVLMISAMRGKKVFFWGEPLFHSKVKLQEWIKRNILAFPLRIWSDSILGIGINAMKSYQMLGYKRAIYNLPYNIDPGLFRPDMLNKDKMANLIHKWKSADEIILLSSGSLINRKGMDTIIKAFLMLPKQINARLLIMGDGDDKNSLHQLIGNESRISLLGFCEKEDIPLYFNLADIFVFASRYDGWGLVINEAIAARNAIICSLSTGAAVDLLKDDFSAKLLDPEDVSGFADAMLSLIKDKSYRSKLVENSSGALVEISSSHNAQKLYDFFTGVK